MMVQLEGWQLDGRGTGQGERRGLVLGEQGKEDARRGGFAPRGTPHTHKNGGGKLCSGSRMRCKSP